MKKKIILGAIAVILIAAAVLFFLMQSGPDLKTYEFLKDPRITTMLDRRMVVVEAKGDPNMTAGRAFGLLFKVFYKIEGASMGPKQPAPVARWAGNVNDKSSWTGYYALPVPGQVKVLPAVDTPPGLKVVLDTWEYGEVAEILHVGPYSAEQPAIEKLKLYIKEKGYRIIGYHEEEYLKGPGMFFTGDPKGYYTIIRYRVKKSS